MPVEGSQRFLFQYLTPEYQSKVAKKITHHRLANMTGPELKKYEKKIDAEDGNARTVRRLYRQIHGVYPEEDPDLGPVPARPGPNTDDERDEAAEEPRTSPGPSLRLQAPEQPQRRPKRKPPAKTNRPHH